MDRSRTRQYHGGSPIFSMMFQKRPPSLALVAALLVLAALVLVGCGGGSESKDPTAVDVPDGTSEPPETFDPNATESPHDSEPTDDAVTEETSRTIREIERSVRRIDSIVRRLPSKIARLNPLGLGPPDEPIEDWFDECCDDTLSDLDEELQTIRQESLELIAVYEEVADQSSLLVVDQVGTAAANIEASIKVVALLPNSAGANSILEEIMLEVEALAEAVANLR